MKIGTLSIEKANGYNAEVCMVGQTDAKELLKRNTFNRKMSERCVEKYLREMQAGQWVATGSGIGIDEEGVLTDGQNRLEAITRYDQKVPLLIVTGLPKMARAKVDRHNKRRIHAALYLSGLTDVEDSYGSQVAVFLAGLADGRLGGAADCDVAAAYEAHRVAISVSKKEIEAGRKGTGQVGFRAAFVLAYEIYGSKAIDFVRLVQSDLQHTRADDPTFRLRKALLGETCTRTHVGFGGGQQMWAFERTVYAFNAWVTGRFINSVLGCREIVKPSSLAK
jgi:hypothetical protein